MENLADWEIKNLNNELTSGKELAKQLQIHFHSPSSSNETRELLLHKVLNSYEKALRMLKSKETAPQPYVTAALRMKSESPPLSQRMSPCSEDSDHEFKRDHQTNQRETPRNRKNMPRWTKHVQVTSGGSGTGLESHVEDGYSWRKYGQKEIFRARYPRSYYRCTFRHVHGCQATKQVQQTNNDEATIFEIRYRGRHTCNQISDPNKPPSTAMNQHLPISTAIPPPQKNSQETLMSFQGLTLKTDYNLDENQFHHQQFADHINCYSSSQAMDKEFGENIKFSFDQANNNFFGGNLMSTHASESNQYNDLFSAGSSAANSPTVGLDFPFGQMEYAPNFTFNNLGFFS